MNARVFASHPVALAHYARVFGPERDIHVVGDHEPFDVGIFDDTLPAFEATLRLASMRVPAMRPLLLCNTNDDDACVGWILRGVWGLVSYDRYEQELVPAVRQIAAGRLWMPGPSVIRWMRITARQTGGDLPLTEREREVLDLVHRQLSNKEIASLLRISERTAKFHVSNLLAKVGAHSRRELAAI